jgi:hypothetical protein
MSRSRDTADQINRVDSSAANATAITIDASENVLVGTTTEGTWSANNSAILRPSGVSTFTSTSTPPLYANRLSTDGTIIDIRKDGSTVGSIGTGGGGINFNSQGSDFAIRRSGTDVLYVGATASYPGSDNSKDLGVSSFRWKDAYLSGGVYLGGTGAANKLDDYEEGDYTATITCTSGSITLDSSYNQLSYTKIGRAVTICGRIHIASVSSPSGSAALSLPFVVATGADHSTYGGLSIYHHDINLGSGGIGLFGESPPNTSVTYINILKNNGQWASSASIFDGGDEWMYFAGTYFTSA